MNPVAWVLFRQGKMVENMDVQQQQIGTRMLFPCFIDGFGLFVGDIHYAQGDEEVAGTMQLRKPRTQGLNNKYYRKKMLFS